MGRKGERDGKQAHARLGEPPGMQAARGGRIRRMTFGLGKRGKRKKDGFLTITCGGEVNYVREGGGFRLSWKRGKRKTSFHERIKRKKNANQAELKNRSSGEARTTVGRGKENNTEVGAGQEGYSFGVQ